MTSEHETVLCDGVDVPPDLLSELDSQSVVHVSSVCIACG